MGSTRATNTAEAAVAVVQSVNETGLTASQFDTIYNVTSFGLACMMASTAFFFLRLGSMTERYNEALCYTGLVTFIAFYHYYRIFNSFDAAFTPCEVVEGVVNPNKCSPELGYSPTGHAFNDAYRYMDWLLTVPLLLIEIVLVMKLSPEETKKQSLRLGVLSGLMILNGYPGESSGDASTRWTYWMLSMLPFCYILPMMSGSTNGKAGLTASSMVAIQVGYTVSDVISKCGVGFLVYNIGLTKSQMELGCLDEEGHKADV